MTTVYLLEETSVKGFSVRVFANRDAAMEEGRRAINDYRNLSPVADEIDEVLAFFNESGGAGDGSCHFYVEVSACEIEE